MSHSFSKRNGPISYGQVKDLKYYVQDNPFDVNSATGGNCTWYAWGRFWEVLASVKTEYKTSRPTCVCTQNACHFYSDGKKNGYSVGLVPKPGAIVCWGYNYSSLGEPGHVAFVEKVFDDGRIEISQSGWSSGPLENRIIEPGNGKQGTGAYKFASDTYFNGFIYNPVDFGNPLGALPSNGSGHSEEWYISRYGNGASVYFEMSKKYGYSHKACCAVLGNMQQESGIKVETGGSYDGNGSEGLCQWTFSRKTTMMSYASKHSASKTWKSIDGQVAYLVYELTHSEKAANKVLQDKSLSLEDMTEEFEKAFERAGVPMMDKRIAYAREWDKRMSGAIGSVITEEVTTSADMKRRIDKLYSSDNYDYLHTGDIATESQKKANEYKSQLKKTLSSINFSTDENDSAAFPESAVIATNVQHAQRPSRIRTKAKFKLSEALIQAPFVEVSFDKYTIGSYDGSLDKYPNYISQLDIEKVNGEINKYTIGIVHQIRPGEDPNLLDRLFSVTRYSKISIRYGDCESGSLFKDTEAIITNIVCNRDYTGFKINYTIYATSACNYVTSIKFDFKATTDKPSNVIRELLYNNSETSKLLLDAFPGMRDRIEVESKGLLPTNDAVLSINAKDNIDTLSYINYLVGCMSNVTNSTSDIIRNSLYYITYSDESEGACFKINEVAKDDASSSLTNSLFEVTVGFPDGNDVYDFRITNNSVWSLLYEKNSTIDEYIFGVSNEGENTLQYSPNLISSSNIMNEIQKNWWTQMTTYPISAQLTMRGLLKPVSLMDYVQINVVFYGQKHITSGLYAITGQQDTLSGSGFKTTLSLTRVGDVNTPYVPYQRTQKISREKVNTNFTLVEDYVQVEEEDLNIGFDALRTPNMSKVYSNTTSNVTTTYNESVHEEDETTTTSKDKVDTSKDKGLMSYQFSGIGKTIKISGKKFESDDKKVATVSKDGVVTSKASGTCHIKVTMKNGDTKKVTIKVPKIVDRHDVCKPLHKAAEEQQSDAWWARYIWSEHPTIENSKTQGTCITFPTIVAQKLGLIKEGTYITGSGNTGSGYDTKMNQSIRAMKKINEKYWEWHKWPKSNVKTLVAQGKLEEGDICTTRNHTFMYAGKKNGNLVFHEAGHQWGIYGSAKGSNRAKIYHQSNGNSTKELYFYAHINDFQINTTAKNGTITASRPYLAGQTVKIEYKPRDGYKLKSLIVDGSSQKISKYPNSYTFKKLDSKHSVKVEFEKK